jgi:hypothetical protein
LAGLLSFPFLMRSPIVSALVSTFVAITVARTDTRMSAGAAIQEFLERPEPAISAHQAVRRLEAHNERFKVTGWLVVCTALQAGHFQYQIAAEGGSGYIRNRVLRKALEGEREAWSSGEVARSGIVPENYTFEPRDADLKVGLTETDSAGNDLVQVALHPKRKSRMLVKGYMFLAPDGNLVRLEGRLASNPSFWTRRVDVVRRYERIAGVRVPVALESVAHVRIAGRSTFRMSYDYLKINDQRLRSDSRCEAIPPRASER